MPPITSFQNKPGFSTVPTDKLLKEDITTTGSTTSFRTNGTSVVKRTPVKMTFAGPNEPVGDVGASAGHAESVGLVTPARSPAAVPNNDPITPSRQTKSYDALTASVRNRMRAMEDAKKPAAGSDSPHRPPKRTPMPPMWHVRTSPSNRTPKFHVSMKSGRILMVDRAGVFASSVMTHKGAPAETGRTAKGAPTHVDAEACYTTLDKDPTVTNEATPPPKAHQTVVVAQAPPSSINEPASEVLSPIRNDRATSRRRSSHNSDRGPSRNLGVAAHGTTDGGEATGDITAVADKTPSTDTGQTRDVTTGESVPGSATPLLPMDAKSVPNADFDSDGGSYPTALDAKSLNVSASGGTISDGDTTKGLTADAVASWAASVAIGAQLPDISNTNGHDQRASHERTHDTSTALVSCDAESAISSLGPLNSISKDSAQNTNTPAGSSSSARTLAHRNGNTSLTPDTTIADDDEVNETIQAMRNMRARLSLKKLNDVSSSWALSQKKRPRISSP